MRDLSLAAVPPELPADAGVRLLDPAARWVLRGDTNTRAAAGQALDLPSLESACRAAVRDDRAALWLGPDERLLLLPRAQAAQAARILTAALRSRPHALVDVSHRQVALQVAGEHAVATLNAGCPLNLDPAEFPVGACTRTVLAKTEIVLWRTQQQQFQLQVWRSFVAYVAAFLSEAARDATCAG